MAEMLFSELRRLHSRSIDVNLIRPKFRNRFAAIARGSRFAIAAERALNRFFYYPRVVRGLRDRFDLFHIVDHSYAHLARELPSNRTIVTCHDLDAFRCLLGEGEERRSWYPPVARRLLDGLSRASVVICGTRTTRDELARRELVSDEKLVVIPYGLDSACNAAPDIDADREAEQMLAGREHIDVLHVGSTISRKRIDVLLEIFAELRREIPAARLVRVGGPFTPEQEALLDRFSLRGAVVSLPFLSRRKLAAVYRRAAVLLLPSEAEGFGLPVIEALACGTPVVCSDLAVLREAGGEAAAYCPVGRVTDWVNAVRGILKERGRFPDRSNARREAGVTWASRFSWTANASQVASL
ncbi:MAG TPA: glycosyltransferase family 1 protein, partial [Candidatus Binataceae bacterium]